MSEEFPGCVDRQPQYVCDGFIAVFHFQRLGVIASAMAGRAGCIHTGQEKQFDKYEPLALAGFTAAFGHIEGKAPGVIFTGTRSFCRCK